MANDTNDRNDARPGAAEGKLAWVHPAVEIFAARDAELTPVVPGTTDIGFYHS